MRRAPRSRELGRADLGHDDLRRQGCRRRLGPKPRQWRPRAGLVAAQIAGHLGAAVADPDRVAVSPQRDTLVDETLRCAVEGLAVAQVAVEGHTRLACVGVVEARRRQRPQRLPLGGQALVDEKTPGQVQATVADSVAPVGVLLVEVGKRRDPPGRPEPRLQVAHAALDRALLPRRPRRAGRRVEGVVAAQCTKRWFQRTSSPWRRATTERRLS